MHVYKIVGDGHSEYVGFAGGPVRRVLGDHPGGVDAPVTMPKRIKTGTVPIPRKSGKPRAK